MGHRFWNWRTTHSIGGLQTGRLQSGGLQSWATGSGAGELLTGLGLQSGGLPSLGQPVLEPENHSLDWGPTVWGPTVLGRQFRVCMCIYIYICFHLHALPRCASTMKKYRLSIDHHIPTAYLYICKTHGC